MTDLSDYTITVTGPDGEILHTHAAPITAEYQQQAIREYLQPLAVDRPDGSYFILASDAEGAPALLDVSEMVRSAFSAADVHAEAMDTSAAADHTKEKLLIECREWLATMRARWSPPKDVREQHALTALIRRIGEALGTGEGS
jgi:hypothetical protein